MPGSPGTVPAPDLPSGPRLALVIATTTYTDPELRRLRAPAQDAADLRQVLADPDIGGFTITSVINKPAHAIRRVSGRGRPLPATRSRWPRPPSRR